MMKLSICTISCSSHEVPLTPRLENWELKKNVDFAKALPNHGHPRVVADIPLHD
eukprot:JP448610.1.p2 GENE.JP448610.1~~JP448610.1.p2  ORF type:complete len:54 (+),score=17.01 JP448610.1:52-213(+)